MTGTTSGRRSLQVTVATVTEHRRDLYMPHLEGKCKILIAFLLFFSITTPGFAEPSIMGTYNERLIVRDASTVLINGTGIFLTTGDAWSLCQGYVLSVKSVNPETKQVWLNLRLGDEILKEGFLSEGDVFVYSKDDEEILNITIDTIYVSPGGELVTFKPIYQYQDRDLPEPVITEEEQITDQDNDNVPEADDNTKQSSGFTIINALAGISLMLLFRRNFTK